MIPNLDLHAQHLLLRDQLTEAFRRVLDRSSFVLGPEVAAFEQEFGTYLQVKHVVGVSSGTAALHAAMLGMGIGPGDEVVVPAMTFFATAEAVAITGARPVFADIDPDSLCLDPAAAEAAITPSTKGILPVHLLGHPAEMDRLRTIAECHGLWICEDCAHAPGSRYKGRCVGALGNTAAFSFYPGKNIGALGEAGAIATDDSALAQALREYRDHGSTEKFRHNRVGLNYRMEGMQAAFLRVKLPHLDKWNARRREIARRYTAAFVAAGIRTPRVSETVESNIHVYAIRVQNRDRIFAELQRRGIGVNIHYPVAMHLHPGFAFLGGRAGAFPVAEAYARETISLPCFPEMSEEQVEAVIREVCAAAGELRPA